MTDEEKKAIEDDIEFDIELKYLNNQEFNINECFYILKKQYFSDDAELKAINYLEQFINKQQKEIEKLKSKKYILNAETKEIKEIPISDDYISKDKILAIFKKYGLDEKECFFSSTSDIIKFVKDMRKLMGIGE